MLSDKVSKLRALLQRPSTPDARREASLKRIARRRRLLEKGTKALPWLSALLIVCGYLYLLAIPWRGLGRRTYMSENAIQPAQVNTYWSWAEVFHADRYAEDIERWDALPAPERAEAIRAALVKNGLRAETQAYSFRLGMSNETSNGVNTHAVMRTTKTDGSEALVLSASWRSRDNDRLNVRGVAVLLALSKYLKHSLWSKDIIFVINDGYIDGMQAWINGYHLLEQSNLVAEPLRLRTGPIWAALSIDYPHHSFSHLGIFFESANGLLPNLDFINSAVHISRWAGGSQVRLHTDNDELRDDHWSGGVLDSEPVKDYERAAINVLSQVKRQATGSPSGPEGVFARYRIDAINLFAIPADGPHGFYSMGKTIESNLRSLNNLLERFHQSFFLYLLTTPDTFISIGNYLAAPMLVSVGLTVEGLRIWATLFPVGEKKPERPVGLALLLVLATHAAGALLFALWSSADPSIASQSSVLAALAISTPSTALLISRLIPSRPANLATILHSFTLLLAGVSLAVVSTLNFSLGMLSAFHLGLPLLLLPRLLHPLSLALITLATPASAALSSGVDVGRLLREWYVVSTWFLPFEAVVVTPLLVQAALCTVL